MQTLNQATQTNTQTGGKIEQSSGVQIMQQELTALQLTLVGGGTGNANFG
jgi:hypothetical protein